jgi:hypothetical protein
MAGNGVFEQPISPRRHGNTENEGVIGDFGVLRIEQFEIGSAAIESKE